MHHHGKQRANSLGQLYRCTTKECLQLPGYPQPCATCQCFLNRRLILVFFFFSVSWLCLSLRWMQSAIQGSSLRIPRGAVSTHSWSKVTVWAKRFMGEWDYKVRQVIEAAQHPAIKSQSAAAVFRDNGQELEVFYMAQAMAHFGSFFQSSLTADGAVSQTLRGAADHSISCGCGIFRVRGLLLLASLES